MVITNRGGTAGLLSNALVLSRGFLKHVETMEDAVRRETI